MALGITLRAEVIGKPEATPWKDNDGKQQFSYKLNIAQNEGVDVATVKCPKDVYDQVRRGDVCDFACSYRTTNDGKGDFRISAVDKFVNMSDAPAFGSGASAAPATPAASTKPGAGK